LRGRIVGLLFSLTHGCFIVCARVVAGFSWLRWFPLLDALGDLFRVFNRCLCIRAMDVGLGHDGIQGLYQAWKVLLHDARRMLPCRDHLIHIPSTHRQQHIVQNSKGRGIIPGPWLCLLYKESSYQPVQVSPATWENTRQLLFNTPIFEAVEQIKGHRIKVCSFQHAEICVPYMGRLMVCEALGQCQQFRLTIHGQ